MKYKRIEFHFALEVSFSICGTYGTKDTVKILTIVTLRPDFKSNLVHSVAFGIPNIYIVLYDEINH